MEKFETPPCNQHICCRFFDYIKNMDFIMDDFGEDDEFDCEFKSETERLSFKNMNDIKLMFKKVYTEQVSYLLIDETVVNWSSRHKLLPIKLQ